ncbi:MAG TPA: AAA family ATPase [Planctomycetaceae bacterium]|nr:AAA family ATPase [Planctomycetaceae bacterium]
MSQIDPIDDGCEPVPPRFDEGDKEEWPGPWPAPRTPVVSVEAATMPDVVYAGNLRNALSKRGICLKDLRDPDLDECHVPPLVVERAGDVAPATPEWLWPNRIPLRRLTILAGDSTAASAVARDIAARVSSGQGWPDAAAETLPAAVANGATVSAGTPAAGKVLILSPRREIAETLVPALNRAGADLAQVFCLDGVLQRPRQVSSGWARPLQLPEDLRSLRRSLRAIGPVRLMIIDPIEPVLDNSDLGSGPALAAAVAAALAEVAYEFNMAVVGVAELRRGGGRSGAGMAVRHPALSAAAQAVWGIARDPWDPEKNIMAPIRLFAGGKEPLLKLTAADGQVEWLDREVPMLVEDAEVACREGLEFATAVIWTRRILLEGPRPKAEMFELAREQGLSQNMLWRVTRELKVKSEKHEVGGRATWSLPDRNESAADEKVPTIGDSPPRLDDFRGIPNRGGDAEGPHD